MLIFLYFEDVLQAILLGLLCITCSRWNRKFFVGVYKIRLSCNVISLYILKTSIEIVSHSFRTPVYCVKTADEANVTYSCVYK